MIAQPKPSQAPPDRKAVVALLGETAQAVRVMKASWLRVAMNLKKIRAGELWRFTDPPCKSFEDYAFGLLKLNRYVALRMLQAIDYTQERRPQLIEEFVRRGDEVDVPSYEVVHQLRRAETALKDRQTDIQDLHSMVFDEGVGRVVLKREIDSRLGRMSTGAGAGAGAGASETAESAETLHDILNDLQQIEKRLLRLKVSKQARKLVFELIETLDKEASRRSDGASTSASS